MTFSDLRLDIRSSNGSIDAQHAGRMFRELYLNERFDLGDVETMSWELQNAYADGLPYPVRWTLKYTDAKLPPV